MIPLTELRTGQPTQDRDLVAYPRPFDLGIGPENGNQHNIQSFQSETKPFPPTQAEKGHERRRPTIQINDRPLDAMTDDAIAALREANHPPTLFQRAGELVRLRWDVREGCTSFESMSLDALRERLARAARWEKSRRSLHSVETIAVSPPMDVVRTVAASPRWPFPAIEAVIEAPTFSREGYLVSEPGYHAASRLYYRHDQRLEIGPVPECPSRIEINWARDLLLGELLSDFPFADRPSQANALAALLLPFVRPMIDGPTPLHLIDAPTQGTGKTLLAQIAGFPALGRAANSQPEGRDDDEWRKRITSILREGPAFVLIDNLRRTLDSGALASALTARIWEDRILGASQIVRLPVTCCWLATGNNVVLSREFTRRTALIRLDARSDRPWLRSGFRHSPLLTWAGNHRGELIQAALILIRAWIAEGRPPGDQTLGMYESWAATMGGILGVADVPGFLGNLKSLDFSVDPGAAEWESFLQAWWDHYGEQPVGVAQLFGITTRRDMLADVLGSESEKSQRGRLGKALTARRDQTIGRYHLEMVGRDHRGCALYRLQMIH